MTYSLPVGRIGQVAQIGLARPVPDGASGPSDHPQE